MLTDFNLLASPFRADRALLSKPYEAAFDALRDTEGSGWVRLNRKIAVIALKGSFDIVDGSSVISWCKKLAASAGSWADPLIAAEQVPTMAMLAGSAGAKAYDCCRIVNILTNANTARYIDDDALAAYLVHYTRNFIANCSGWGQYLASVAVGKIAFQAMHSTSKSLYIVDAQSILEGIHIMALSAPVTLFRSRFWPPEDLSALINAVEALLPADRVRAARLGVTSWMPETNASLDAPIAQALAKMQIDAASFLRARALAYETFCSPVDMAGLWGVFEDLRSSRVPLWDLPARTDGSASKAFWNAVSADRQHWAGVPFLLARKMGRATAILSEEACVVITHRGMRRTFNPIPWEQVSMTASVIPGEHITFHANGVELGSLFPEWDMLRAVGRELPWRLDAFLNGMGARVRSFTAANPL